MNVKDLLNLKGKIVVVTGGAGNYGKCIVEGLAEADATVITASRNIDKNKEVVEGFRSAGLDVYAMQVDQGDHSSVLRLKEEIQDKFGALHVFVNNAVSRPMANYDSPIEQFEESMRVNATGMVFIMREMTDLIVKSGGGSVISIGSMMGMFGPDLSNYDGTDMNKNPPPDYFFHNSGLLNLTRYWGLLL